jgi:chromate reductase, NAD(P)H dehydrogenase (quinone)
VIRVLAISGSLRSVSRSTRLLRSLAEVGASRGLAEVTVWDGLGDLPIFSPDHEGPPGPEGVEAMLARIAAADALVIAAPEYVHTLPGGLKNAIDWGVSRTELIGKPIALLHASLRGDDMLAQLRLVLQTVSDRFAPQIFLRLPITALPEPEVAHALTRAEPEIASFLADLSTWVRQG